MQDCSRVLSDCTIMENLLSEFDWSKDNIIKLIELFRDYPVLWDAKVADYKNRNKKHDAWNEIALAMKVERSEVEKKMRCLIGQYQRNTKKAKSGAGADGDPKWPYFNMFTFLKDKCKPRSYCESGRARDANEDSLVSGFQ